MVTARWATVAKMKPYTTNNQFCYAVIKTGAQAPVFLWLRRKATRVQMPRFGLVSEKRAVISRLNNERMKDYFYFRGESLIAPEMLFNARKPAADQHS